MRSPDLLLRGPVLPINWRPPIYLFSAALFIGCATVWDYARLNPMNANPTVCAIMLVNGRREMVRRAVESFRNQTYANKRLVIYSTGTEEPHRYSTLTEWINDDRVYTEHFPAENGDSIGKLRNAAGAYAYAMDAEIIMHWDSDDWSHPKRIFEQVQLLECSKVACVGYNSMVFWDTRPGQFAGAWLYKSDIPDYMLGTSLCYWTSAWRQVPFADTPKVGGQQIGEGEGEDLLWQRQVPHLGRSSIDPNEPRMIAGIHGGNTLGRITPGMDCWSRTPKWDAYCAERMAL